MKLFSLSFSGKEDVTTIYTKVFFLEQSVSTDNASEEAPWIRTVDESKGRILPLTGASCPAAPAVMTAYSCTEPTTTSSFICIGSYFYESNVPSSFVTLSRGCYTIFFIFSATGQGIRGSGIQVTGKQWPAWSPSWTGTVHKFLNVLKLEPRPKFK